MATYRIGDPLAFLKPQFAPGTGPTPATNDPLAFLKPQFAPVDAPAPLEQTTPFASSGGSGTLGKRVSGPAYTGTACAALQARAQRYPGVDPVPAVRRALVEKCEAEQRAGGGGVRADVPTGYPEPNEGMDPKVKIAIGAGAALVLGFVAFKVFGK